MIADEFPNQGQERHLSSEGRTQMAGDIIRIPYSESTKQTNALIRDVKRGTDRDQPKAPVIPISPTAARNLPYNYSK